MARNTDGLKMSDYLGLIGRLTSLHGRAAVITGGAGHIGRALASVFLELGARVCLVDRDEASVARAVESTSAGTGARAVGLVVDLEREADRTAIVPRVQEAIGDVSILVNNAGFVGDSTLKGWVVPFEEQQIDTWRRALEVNLTAAFHLTQLFTPQLGRSGKGSVVNIGSIYGVVGPDMRLYQGTGMGNPAAYAASKGGLIQVSRWLAAVLAPNIRVNCVSPGGLARNQPQGFVDRYRERTPMQRLGTEQDIVGAVTYFATDMSAWVTGENLLVDGGWTVW
jgi:NAD(P)-dependent dehydrogenase (short-subunit alcohol dehydrogenase family)